MKNNNLKLSTTQVDAINNMLIQASLRVSDVYSDYVAGIVDIDIQQKTDASPVTKADMLLHTLITEQLACITPSIFCLSEESAAMTTDRKKMQQLWLLDPVDGTKAFIKKTGEFTINLTLIHGNQVLASWIVVPMQAVLYCAFTDSEYIDVVYEKQSVYALSFMEQLAPSTQACMLPYETVLPHSFSPIDTSVQSLEEKLSHHDSMTIKVGLSRSTKLADYQHFFDALKKRYGCTIELVQSYSAYKFVQMLRGDIDIYVRAYPTYEWDTASGQGLIEALGGQLLTFHGKPFTYNDRDTLLNGGFVCFNHADDSKHIVQACQQFVSG